MMNAHIIVPAHNEAENISHCIRTLTTLYPNCVITVATDGNSDATEETAREHELEHTNLFVSAYPYRIGKGAAIKQALIFGAVNAYIDADLAVNPTVLQTMFEIVEKTGGLVIAKRVPTNRSFKRAFLSKAYNALVRFLFHTNVADHQCGCKVLSVKATAIAGTAKANGFFFDTELIVECKRRCIPINEVTVPWTEHKKNSTVNIAKDGWCMFKALVKLKIKKCWVFTPPFE